MGELLELLVAVVVDEDVQREDVPDGLQRVVVQRRHGRVVDGEHRDGLPPVDLLGELCLRQEAVEGAEVGELAEKPGDVEGRRRRGEADKDEEERNGGRT